MKDQPSERCFAIRPANITAFQKMKSTEFFFFFKQPIQDNCDCRITYGKKRSSHLNITFLKIKEFIKICTNKIKNLLLTHTHTHTQIND